MPVLGPPEHYCAYLLRCWAEHSAQHDHPLIWRFSVQDPHTGKQRGFASFDLLVEFLLQELHNASLDTTSEQN